LIRKARTMPYLLAPNDPSASFPRVSEALTEPDGLLAVGGDLGIKRLVAAYRQGIFPWYSQGDPILWWSPDPRTVLVPSDVRISRSLGKLLRKGVFGVTMDRDFAAVINACALPREPDGGTWLVPEMISAYRALHIHGVAHSVEVWKDGALAGGLYGVAIGGIFFGESMFTRVDNASKVALVQLCQRLNRWGFGLIDCQVLTPHLVRMGARQIPRHSFIRMVEHLRDLPAHSGSWDDNKGIDPTATSARPPAAVNTAMPRKTPGNRGGDNAS
jgi:leucyl/phenylalanyl-tRNA--protein transferase